MDDMTGVGWFMTIIIGAIAGWLAEKVMKADMGLLMNIIIGILGAILFNWLLSLIMGEALVGWLGSLIAGFIGACILIFLARLVRGKRA
ncbi:putative membrane protein YeaQ/YmgE (transglycosylase-associated protein family) [Limimaricola variabilis]|uniref:Membrane protein YeaQ/YmgE (Transglycosylase-associated protein family) n=2 Tax=Limimaricola variabilis TaxID=1492771 RepID=A0ABR6HLG6_9RHOB|nr:putative membrane protein YeaQ/YmgE (transglycosylase-associated protein family) [Limimaricola variabilis]